MIHEGARYTAPSKERQLQTRRDRIESVLADPSILDVSFQSHRDFGPSYGYRDGADWWETEVLRADKSIAAEFVDRRPEWTLKPVVQSPVRQTTVSEDEQRLRTFLASYTGSYNFLRSIAEQASKGRLSQRQVEAGLRCMEQESRFAEERKARQEQAEKRDRQQASIASVGDGMFRNPEDGTIIKVQVAVHGSGRLYAKRLTQGQYGEWEFVYEAGLINRIRPEWKLTLAEAQQFGKLYGVCCVCGKTLTNEESIAAGIGPVCAGKEFA